MAPLTIAYCGNFSQPWCTEVHVARDAERIDGVEVVRISEPRGSTATEVRMLQARIEEAHPQLVLYQKTFGLHVTATEMWRELERQGMKTASYHLDLYARLPRGRQIGNDPFWRTGTVFSADGDPKSADVFAEHGINHHWLPGACVSDECVVVEPVDIEPVIFVGSHTAYHSEWPWRMEMVKGLRRYYGDKFAAYPKTEVRVHGLELNAMYAGAKVVVGDSLCLPDHRDYWSDRCFEVTGRGGFLVFPNVPGIEAFFTDRRHLRLYEPGNIEALTDIVDYYLDHQDEADVMRWHGQVHTSENHTYVQRVTQMLNVLGL